jgi:hypothetical protein
VTEQQLAASCPQCGSSAAVHSISELADLARLKLGEAQPGFSAGSQPGFGPGPQPGYAAEPQAGPPPGLAGQPMSGPLPGYAAEPRSGPPPGSRPGWTRDYDDTSIGDGIDQAIADVALNAAARFIGRAVSRRVQRAYNDRVAPALAAQQQKSDGPQALLRDQIAIAERYPELRACLTDKVIFLAGGSRVLPMTGANLMITLQQADGLVAQLREG